jgi:type II secretory pathway component PulJ
MRSLDIPELLIAMGILAMLAWAVYNRIHPVENSSKQRSRVK